MNMYMDILCFNIFDFSRTAYDFLPHKSIWAVNQNEYVFYSVHFIYNTCIIHCEKNLQENFILGTIEY
jgi:hypothetical protein